MSFWSQLIGHPADRVAIIDEKGEHTYKELLDQARCLAGYLKEHKVEGEFVAFLTGREASFAVTLLAIWLADAVAVPLDPLMPVPEWEWRINDLSVKCLVCSPEKHVEASALGQRLSITTLSLEDTNHKPLSLQTTSSERCALVLYTSGTCRSPRGVVHTFQSLEAQVKTLCIAWDWQTKDRLLHILPLAHIHGLVCGLLCTLAAGGSCEILPSFKTLGVWESLAKGDKTLLTAVPTIYKYLVEAWQKAPPEDQKRWQEGAKKLRLAIVGSSPLTASVHKAWRKISGKPLLSRYGMTETGMVLSQSLDDGRAQDSVGQPLAGVSVRLVGEHGREVETIGELEIRSPQMFAGYFGREDLNQQAFRDGWFRTGDMVVLEEGSYRLLGRRSIDIIKTGGYRVSALEVESLLDAHPAVEECAVLGTPSQGLGEEVCACIVPASRHLNLGEIQQWLRTQLAMYKLPTQLRILESLPKTQVGKTDKQALKRRLSLLDLKTDSDQKGTTLYSLIQ